MTGDLRQSTPDSIRRELIGALAARDGARAACRHSPNSDTIAAVGQAQAAIDDLLDQLADALRVERTP